MPQIIGAILAILLLILAVAIAVWIISWAVAIVVWIFQAILIPVFIFLLPAIIALIILAGLYWGSWVAARNYFQSVRTNINPQGHLRSVIQRGVVVFQTLTLTAVCAVFTVVSAAVIYGLSMQGVSYVQGYYTAIEFPFFDIVFPFWAGS